MAWLPAQHTDSEALRTPERRTCHLLLRLRPDGSLPCTVATFVQLDVMRHLQLGHRPLALVERPVRLRPGCRAASARLQSTEVRAERLQAQISKFLDFEGPAAAQMVNNLTLPSTWAAHYRQILPRGDANKDIVARRQVSDEGISYIGVLYQVPRPTISSEPTVVTAARSKPAATTSGATWPGGVDLIRKVEGVDTHVMTTPIITKADGTKLGKSEAGPSGRSTPTPFAWLQVADEDVVRFEDLHFQVARGELWR